MGISADSPTYVDRVIGQQWLIRVRSSELPALVVLLPDGSTLTPVVEFSAEDVYDEWSTYVATLAPAVAGRYIASVTTATQGSLIFQAMVAAVTANADMPDAAELSAWIMAGSGSHSWETEELTGALAVEAAAQRRVCSIPAAYPADLREALLRRAARSLFMRRQLTEMPRSDAGDFDLPPTMPPGRDAEVRRLEAPFRKLVTG